MPATWWHHQMETFFTFLAICAGNSPVPGESPSQRPVTRSFDVYFDLRPNKQLSKRSWGWWFEMQSRSLWRHRNDQEPLLLILINSYPSIKEATVICHHTWMRKSHNSLNKFIIFLQIHVWITTTGSLSCLVISNDRHRHMFDKP